jgi:hypothetical protein
MQTCPGADDELIHPTARKPMGSNDIGVQDWVSEIAVCGSKMRCRQQPWGERPENKWRLRALE